MRSGREVEVSQNHSDKHEKRAEACRCRATVLRRGHLMHHDFVARRTQSEIDGTNAVLGEWFSRQAGFRPTFLKVTLGFFDEFLVR